MIETSKKNVANSYCLLVFLNDFFISLLIIAGVIISLERKTLNRFSKSNISGDKLKEGI